MKLDKTARAILGVTALAWSIPFAQAAETRQPGVLSGFVADETQKQKALLVAPSVKGVEDVKDGIAIPR